MGSESGVLYIGVTGNILQRVKQHKSGQIKGFTQKYKCKKLLYYESYEIVFEALEREKEIKKWRREKKLRLIGEYNPGFEDISRKFVYGV